MKGRSHGYGTRALAAVLAVLFVGGILLSAMPGAVAPLSGRTPVFAPGKYTGTTVYVPSETLSFTLEENGAVDLVYDAAVVFGNNALKWYNDVTVPGGGSKTLAYDIPSDLPDGSYAIQVGGPNFNATFPAGMIRQRGFSVQEYEFTMEADRQVYIGGDSVRIAWSATRIRDGSLAPDGFGQIWVYNETWEYSFISPTPHVFNKSTGSLTLTLPGLADPDFDGIVEGWFNSTTSNPTRSQYAFTSFQIGILQTSVNVVQSQYSPGGIVRANIGTSAYDAQFGFSVPEPNIDAVITVWELQPSGDIPQTAYGASGLVTDAHGQLTHIFQLATSVADGTQFEVRLNASTQNGFWTAYAEDSFSVSAAAGLSLVLQADRTEYQAGATATVTAIVSGAAGATITYTFEVRDATSFCGAAGLLATRIVTTTEPTAEYSYQIDSNFAGRICFIVTVDDGSGNQATDSVEFPVVFGWLLVNANPQEYRPSESITVTWELQSNRITNPAYHYEVEDANGNLVGSGTATDSYVFSVPTEPSDDYTFRVYASEAGRTVSGEITVSRVQGYSVTVTFDRSSYGTGDTMRIQYTVSPRGTQPLPNTFDIRYGLWNAVSHEFRTTADKGEITYVVPAGTNEGDQGFFVTVYSSGRWLASADEIVTIRGTSPLWFITAGDIPLVVILIIIWLLVITLLLWRRGAFGGAGTGAPKAPAAPPPMRQEPVPTSATTPMTVTCRNCGAPIEITTSKRPIEVMCPKCGGTEVVA